MTSSRSTHVAAGALEPLPGLQALGDDDAGVCVDGFCVIPAEAVDAER